MPLAAGQTLAFYEILGPLGAGGMGEVYRARDTRLEREVAIKVLPEELADEPQRLKRFEREARALASLNHPNIAGIHGVDRDDGVVFLALELVPGKDLSTLLARGPLPMEQALDIARQIAEGLEAAHEAGVIHRDLKPANVRVTPDGVVKLLDFGLAKSMRSLDQGGSSAAPDSFQISEQGLVLGTPTYMSPEQARGLAVCRRTDVWAFGCVLFECLTGKRAHGGKNLAEILAAVLEREWDRRALPAATPPQVRELLERCLDRDPRQRLRDIGEARIRLERVSDPAFETAPSRRAGPLLTGVLLLVALAIGALVGRELTPAAPAAQARAIQLERLTERAGMEVTPAVSPDERTLAFIALQDGRRHVFLRRMGGDSPKPITSGEFDHSFPRWVDEDTLLYYRHPLEGESQGSLWLAPILSASQPEFVASADGEADVSRFGQIATVRLEADGARALLVMDLKGRVIESRPLPLRIYNSLRWSPDGQLVAIAAQVTLAGGEIHILDAKREGSTVYETPRGRTRGLAWLSDSSALVYASSSGSTMAYPPTFALRVLRLEDGRDEPLPTTDSLNVSYVEPEVTPSGRLVASRILMQSDVYRYPVDGTPLENMQKAERITFQTGLVQVPSASPDGEKVAYLSNSGGHANIWIADIDGSPPRQVTDVQDPGTTVAIPNWSPQGDRLVYYKSSAEHGAEQWLVHTDAADQQGERAIGPTGGGAVWTRDGEWIYQIDPSIVGTDSATIATQKVHVDSGRTVKVRDGAGNVLINSDESVCYFTTGVILQGDLYKASPPETGEPELLRGGLQSRIPLWPHHYTLSPNDQWLATPLKDQDTTNLFLISTETGEETQITDFGDRATMIARQISWSGDSRFLYAAVMDTDADIVLLNGALD